MTNQRFYDKLKNPPATVLKKITGGRLSGMTDIKPQWRIEVMTDVFGPIGIGWYYDDVRFEYINCANGEVVCNCHLSVYIKDGDEWSKAIFGTGGSKLVSNEKSGPYVSDEAEKMAMTDALSVALKAIGVAANVYMGHSFPTDKKTETPVDVSTKELILKSDDWKKVKSYIESNKSLGIDLITNQLSRKYTLSPNIIKEIKLIIDGTDSK